MNTPSSGLSATFSPCQGEKGQCSQAVIDEIRSGGVEVEVFVECEDTVGFDVVDIIQHNVFR